MARRAEPTLWRIVIHEGLLQRRHVTVALQPLYGHDLPTVCPHCKCAARVYGLPVEKHRTRAAFTAVAADLGAREPEVVPEELVEGPPVLHLHPFPASVDRDTDGGLRNGLRL